MTAPNAGVAGDTAAKMHARLATEVVAKHPWVVVILVGTNDVFDPPAV